MYGSLQVTNNFCNLGEKIKVFNDCKVRKWLEDAMLTKKDLSWVFRYGH